MGWGLGLRSFRRTAAQYVGPCTVDVFPVSLYDITAEFNSRWLTGPPGIEGLAGPTGPTGAKGQAGSTGSTGAVGDTGSSGLSSPQTSLLCHFLHFARSFAVSSVPSSCQFLTCCFYVRIDSYHFYHSVSLYICQIIWLHVYIRGYECLSLCVSFCDAFWYLL